MRSSVVHWSAIESCSPLRIRLLRPHGSNNESRLFAFLNFFLDRTFEHFSDFMLIFMTVDRGYVARFPTNFMLIFRSIYNKYNQKFENTIRI